MLYYEPTFTLISNAPQSGVASTTRIGSDGATKIYDTAVRFCEFRGEKFQNAYLDSSNTTITYWRPTNSRFEQKSEQPFSLIECVASTTPQEDVNLTLDVQIPNSDLVGLFLGISVWFGAFYITYFIVRRFT